MLRSTILGLVLATALTTPTQASGPREVADAPESVHPLLIGATVPDLVLKSSDGKAFDLGEAIGKKPTILVVYRGGW